MNEKIKKIEWGKWKQLTSGGDTIVIATGTMVESAREAHDLLKNEIESIENIEEKDQGDKK